MDYLWWVPGPRSKCPKIPGLGVLVPLLHHAMTDLFIRRRDISSWEPSGTFGKHFGKCSNGKLRNANDGILRSRVDFVSALSNVNNLKIFNMTDFL